jgi:NADH-quinone oxidoreductase subunit F
MLFKAFCALADGAVSPIDSSIKFFRDEYEEHVRLGRCPFREASPTLQAVGDRSGGTFGGTAQYLPEGEEIRLGEVLG